MPDSRTFPACYDPSSEREIVTPSAFGRRNLFFLQEAGHIKLVQSHAGTQRSSLDSFLLVAVAAGSGTLQYGGKVHPLRAGQCFWVDCRRPHGYRAADDDPWELRWVHFNGLSAPGFYRLYEAGGGPVFAPMDFEAVTRRMESVLDAARHWDAPAELTASAEMAALLTGIVNERAGGAQTPPAAAARLDEVRTWLAGHAAEEITLEEPAARFYISKYYLAHSFKQRYGETVFAFLNNARIDAAKQMLRYTDLSLAEIARRCGFKEQNYFTRRFRAAEGQTAFQYRRAWRGR